MFVELLMFYLDSVCMSERQKMNTIEGAVVNKYYDLRDMKILKENLQIIYSELL